MTLDIAIIASNPYTYQSGWRDTLSDIADQVQNRWNNDLADSWEEEVSIETPLASEYSGLSSDGISTPTHDRSSYDFRDIVQQTLEYSTYFFDHFDSVAVHTTADMGDTGGIAYIGGVDDEQAAGSEYGVAIIFQSSDVDTIPGIITYHELLHTFSARHTDGRRIPPGWFSEGEESVMCGNANGCNDNVNLNPNQWVTTDCTDEALSDYVTDYM